MSLGAHTMRRVPRLLRAGDARRAPDGPDHRAGTPLPSKTLAKVAVVSALFGGAAAVGQAAIERGGDGLPFLGRDEPKATTPLKDAPASGPPAPDRR